jgi:hypothetical protein
MRFFLSQPFWIFKRKKKLLHLNENKQPLYMRYHLFLHYGWFLQNLGKDFIRTNMHTTVARSEFPALLPLIRRADSWNYFKQGVPALYILAAGSSDWTGRSIKIKVGTKGESTYLRNRVTSLEQLILAEFSGE